MLFLLVHIRLDMVSLARDSVVGVGDSLVSICSTIVLQINIKGLTYSEHFLVAAESFCERVSVCEFVFQNLLSLGVELSSVKCKAVCVII